MKRVAAILLALAMAVPFASCATNDPSKNPGTSARSTTEAQKADGTTKTPGSSSTPDNPETPDDRTVFALNGSSAWVKKLDPRMEATADGIPCDWSASGIEFVATGKGDMTFALTVTTNMGAGKEGCFFRAYVDGAAYLNGESAYYEVKKGDATITLKNLPEGTHTIRLVKVTGYTLANTMLKSVSFDGTVAETAPAAKNLLLEFVGDSICCGWGVIVDHKGAYSDQDATMAYPYLIAEAMGADLSVMALSGQGLTVGNPGIFAGYKYASPNRSMKTEYSFARKADYSILNVGTNDAFQNLSAADFEAKLKAFIAVVREKNGLSYNIEASYTPYGDTGIVAIYFSSDHSNAEQCIELIEGQLHKLRTVPLTARQLSMAKKQFIAQLAISSESNESYMLGAGKSLLVHDGIDTMEQVYAKVRALTARQLTEVAEEVFSDMSRLIYK